MNGAGKGREGPGIQEQGPRSEAQKTRAEEGQYLRSNKGSGERAEAQGLRGRDREAMAEE